ncbi:ABC transporter substrate-binding protein [Roseateles oligotrophus]|uniref:Extracellular solute-binding protein n=1 Tax=Roseateles oligotrophus TaxID=1769250 RepID=A0ABT2YCV9_9BURK|nr:extracellular solute-binding protein [Roseateles oligotrophus]MCV2367875.1 extracellular solute-binding protein [Roseateles oligotrophus]
MREQRRKLILGMSLGVLSGRPHAAAQGKPRLRVLAWPGYAEPEVIKSFEQSSGASVELTLIDSDLDLWQKMNAKRGADFDVFAVNTAELTRYVEQGLVANIEAGLIPNLAQQLPRFRRSAAIPGVGVGAQTLGVPFAFAEMGLIYDRRQMQRPPDSVTALWDPHLRGRVIAYDGGTHNFSLAAQVLRLPTPFKLAESDWAPAVDRLIALRRNVAGFYTRPEESVALFKRRQAVLMFANFGRQQLLLLKSAGVDADYVIPSEGALAWLDCWVVSSAAQQNTKLAHAWINHLLEQPASHLLTSRQGLGNTTQASADYRADDKLLWLQAVESEERRNLLWGRIISGDRASKVLAT